MSALLEAPAPLFASASPADGPRPTLEELLESRWRAASAGGSTECPVCQAEMRLQGEQARCGACGTTLS